MSNIDVKRSALLVMDMQVGIVDMAPDPKALLRNTGVALKAARQAGMMVAHVGVGFRNGFPEVHANNAMFSGLKKNNQLQAQPQHPDLAPQGNEVLVIKRRVSSFYATDLDMILRSHGVDTVYLTGFATSGVVLATACGAADQDYRVRVLDDCCADFRPDVQAMLMEHVFPLRAEVTNSGAFVSALGAK